MKTLIVAKQVEVTEKMKELFDKKLSKFDKFFGKDTEAVIKLSRAHGMEKLHDFPRRGNRRNLPERA